MDRFFISASLSVVDSDGISSKNSGTGYRLAKSISKDIDNRASQICDLFRDFMVSALRGSEQAERDFFIRHFCCIAVSFWNTFP